jgi:hypothetical protein
MTHHKRLTQLQQQLSPRDHILNECRQWQTYASVNELIYQTMQPAHDLQAKQVIDTLKAQARAAGKANETTVRRQLQKELNCYTKLSTLPMMHFEAKRYEWLYQASQLALLNLWLVKQFDQDDDTSGSPLGLESLVDQWSALYVSLHGFQGWVDHVSLSWMGGIPLLIQDQQALLTDLQERLDLLKESIRYLSSLLALPPPLDDDALKDSVNTNKQQWLTRMQHELQVHLLECQGKEDQAAHLEKQWLLRQFSV